MKATKDNLKLGDEIYFTPCVGSPLSYTVVRFNDKSVWVSAGTDFTYRKSWQSISKYDIYVGYNKTECDDFKGTA